MKITVCIGSSCHLKGSRQVVEKLQNLISKNSLKDNVELGGVFCLNNCQIGVCVNLEEQYFSLTPENTEKFFHEHVLAKEVEK